MRSIYHWFALLMLLLVASSPLLQSQQWNTLTPQGLSANLYGLYFSDASNGWFVGWDNGYSVLGRTTDGGANWMGWTLNNALLFDIQFTDAAHGYITGYRGDCSCGFLMYTSNGGGDWRELWFDGREVPTIFGFYRVVFTSPMVGYLSGYNSALMKTTDGGATWKRGAIESTGDVFRILEFPDATTGYAAGGDDFSLMYKIYRTSDAGESWELVNDFQKSISIGSLTFLDADTGFLAGNGQGGGLISKTTDGGQTWRRVYSGAAQLVFQSIRFADAHVGYAVGTDGVIVRSTDGGETWMQEQSSTTSVLTAVAPRADGSVYVVGFEGAVLKRSGSAATVATTHRSPESVAVSPNPFRSSTRLLLDTGAPDGAWQLTLHDVMGQRVRMLSGEREEAIVITRDDLSAGTYFYTLTVDGSVQATGTMTVY